MVETQTTAARTRAAIAGDLLGLTFISLFLAAWWSNNKLLNQDEMFAYQTDTVRTLGDVVRVQLHYPISLDPMVYHALAHLCTRVMGPTPMAMRVPSMLGYTLMLWCVYFFTLRAANVRYELRAARLVAVFAAIVPMVTATFYYATEARPYGLLLGFYALAFLCWQRATRDAAARRWALPVLGVAVALALNSHYFAVLLLPVLFLAELARTVERRRLDAPLVSALLLGTAAIVFTLPFQHAVREFQKHYYNAGGPSVRAVTQAYRSLFVDYTSASERTQHWAAVLFVVLALVFVGALVVRWKSLLLPRAESVLLVSTAALPFFGFLLARFVTHSYEVRYVIGAVIGISILLALLLAEWIVPKNIERPRQRWLPYLLSFAVIVLGNIHVNVEKRKSAAMLSSLQVPASVRAAMDADPAHGLYMQQMGHYELMQFYEPDVFVRDHTVLVYDAAREVRLAGHDTEALTAEHMMHFTALPIARYDAVKADADAHTWLVYSDGWDFAHKALPEDGAQVKPLTPFFEGEAESVQFPR